MSSAMLFFSSLFHASSLHIIFWNQVLKTKTKNKCVPDRMGDAKYNSRDLKMVSVFLTWTGMLKISIRNRQTLVE